LPSGPPPRAAAAENGGTERMVSYLTEELVREGHHVTLYASGDSDRGRAGGITPRPAP
jgi:hypothetical protein